VRLGRGGDIKEELKGQLPSGFIAGTLAFFFLWFADLLAKKEVDS
jgi:hypothetical protein